MNTKRKNDRAFKERAVKMSYERSSITELASELGVLPDRITVGARSSATMARQPFQVTALNG